MTATTDAPATPARTGRKSRYSLKESLLALAFLAPSALIFYFFFYRPFFDVMSWGRFESVRNGASYRNVGLTQYREQLTGEYANAEYGYHGPRPLLFCSMWVAALLPFVGMVLLSFRTDATNAYAQGIADADPHATGTYTWSGLHLVQSRVTYTFVDGHATWVGGAFTPLVYVLLLAVLIVLGKLWRFPTYWRQWRAAARRARVQQPA